MRIGGEWAQGPWEVRGTAGKRTFTHGVTAGDPKVDDVVDRVVKAALR